LSQLQSLPSTNISTIFGFHSGATNLATFNENSSGFAGIIGDNSAIPNTTQSAGNLTNIMGVFFLIKNQTLSFGKNNATGTVELVANCGVNYPSPIVNNNASYQLQMYTNGRNSTFYMQLDRVDIKGYPPCTYNYTNSESNMPVASQTMGFRLIAFKSNQTQAVAVAMMNYYQDMEI